MLKNLRLRLDSLVYLATLVALVGFQALFFFVVSADHYLWVAVLCVAMDVVLVAALRYALRRRARDLAARYGDVRTALQIVLDLTRTQHEHWTVMLRGLAQLAPEDRITLSNLQETMTALDQVEGKTLQGSFPVGATVESMIDGIQTVIFLNHGLMTDLDAVLRLYQDRYAQFQRVRTENDLNHFRLDETVTFLSDMGRASTAYSERLVLEVLTSFRQITSHTQAIGTQVVDTVHRLMDASNSEGLDSISRESVHIKNTMDGFFRQLEAAIQFSRQSVQRNLDEIGRVREMAQAISEFSESIRMISLNLNIEAARGGHNHGSGKGFQVLAVKLSEFALKAQDLAKQQADTIESAQAVIASTGTQQMDQLGALLRQIPGLQGRLDPFARIIQSAYGQFETVEHEMDGLARAIDDQLQSVIGKLQFQDLARQEQDHVLTMFSHIRDLAWDAGGPQRPLEAVHQAAARAVLIQHYERLATTENELGVIRAYRAAHPDLAQAKEARGTEKDGAPSAGSVSLF